MSDPWSEEPEAAELPGAAPRLPLAHSAPGFGEPESFALAPLPVAVAGRPAKKPWQFSLGRLQLLIVILCVCTACLGALLQVNQDEFTFVGLLLLILPSGVLILLGLGRGGIELYKIWRADRALWHQEPWQKKQTSLPDKE